jgi:subtilisin family serine protease
VEPVSPVIGSVVSSNNGLAGKGSVLLKWSAPQNNGGSPISSYKVYSQKFSDGVWSEFAEVDPDYLTRSANNSLQTLVNNLDLSFQYRFKVSAENSVGEGQSSASSISVIPRGKPVTPSIGSVVGGNGLLTVNWSLLTGADTGGLAVTYVAEASTTDTFTSKKTCSTTSSSCTITGLVNGTNYYVRLLARNSLGSNNTYSTNELITLGITASDPYFVDNSLWGLNGTYGISADKAWNKTQGSSSVVVAVIDTGITNHPDLNANVLPGFDFISNVGNAGDGNGRDSDPSDPGDWSSRADSSWHGTHVAGTIAGISNNVGVIGVAPKVKILPIRALGFNGGTVADILAAITWASGGTVLGVPPNANPAKIINLSLGGAGSCDAAWESVINDAETRGSIVVASAGNADRSAANYTPAGCTKVITVAATDSDGRRADFSNYGTDVEISAPGVNIWSTLNAGTTSPSTATYGAYQGTSMAAPHVSGALALLLSYKPDLSTPSGVITRIKEILSEALNVKTFPGGICDINPAKTCGTGIIDIDKILTNVT